MAKIWLKYKGIGSRIKTQKDTGHNRTHTKKHPKKLECLKTFKDVYKL